MATDLSGANYAPWVATATVGTTWTQFTLPSWCTSVLITVEGDNGYVAGSTGGTSTASPVTATDAGAVSSTARQQLYSNTPFLQPTFKHTGNGDNLLFIARETGSGNVTLQLLGRTQ